MNFGLDDIKNGTVFGMDESELETITEETAKDSDRL